jgi:hypothetical protein
MSFYVHEWDIHIVCRGTDDASVAYVNSCSRALRGRDAKPGVTAPFPLDARHADV